MIGGGLVRDEDGILAWRGGRDYKAPAEQVKTWWAGVLRPGCNERMFENYSSHPCGKTPKHDPDAQGRPTKCGTHCQSAKDARKAKADAKMKALQDKWERHRAITAAVSAIEPALRKIAAGHNDPRTLAQEVIAALDDARKATP